MKDDVIKFIKEERIRTVKYDIIDSEWRVVCIFSENKKYNRRSI